MTGSEGAVHDGQSRQLGKAVTPLEPKDNMERLISRG